MKKVIKRKGNVESFNPNKIKGSLQKATIDAGYTLDEKKDIINEVLANINKKIDDEKEIKSETIKRCLLTELDKCEPYIAKSCRRFDSKYKSR
ncbi:MAG: ATP cone domain-containing protein [Euryarchaeota archaeon]|uniref:ATP cone domain-containing protein n=1 Tax=Methanobacterium sp. MZD130B TaxID=3394378 RepID=UPI0009CAB627|nr:ATP cone domain-containing protein [Euryarchaeota archaeon]OPZ94283.1 MAG: transcriptional regulator NrdR [Firmicutes bacterium ADurb.Bin419]HHT19344.1 transcriptional regulator [Methanobacterium sp.]